MQLDLHFFLGLVASEAIMRMGKASWYAGVIHHMKLKILFECTSMLQGSAWTIHTLVIRLEPSCYTNLVRYDKYENKYKFKQKIIKDE